LLLGIPFSQKKRCHPEPFLCPLQRQSTTTIQNTKKNAVILSPFYARCNAKPQPSFQNTKKYAVILSPFYAHCNAKQQPQSQRGIKREKDLAELLRHPKSQAQATIACCLASFSAPRGVPSLPQFLP
jgi:hypothetical protein